MDQRKIKRIYRDVQLLISTEIIKEIENGDGLEWSPEWAARYVGKVIGGYLQSEERWGQSIDIAAQKHDVNISSPQIRTEKRLAKIKNNLEHHVAEAKRKGLAHDLTLTKWLSAVEYFNNKCAYCQEMPYQVIEHFMPIELGGGTTQTNCVPACHKCNRKKGKHMPDSIHHMFSQEFMSRVLAYFNQF